MIVLGLTGSVGMGKSVAARALHRLGAALFDADAEVHRLLGPGGGAVAAVASAFPDTNRGGAIDRGALAARVFDDDRVIGRLEAILHPLVKEAEGAFLMTASARRHKLAVLDIPLLFETGGDKRCDAVAVVTAPAFLQAQRVLRRAGMTSARLKAVRARQMPDREKRRRADFVIHTGLSHRFSLAQLQRMVSILTNRPDDEETPDHA